MRLIGDPMRIHSSSLAFTPARLNPQQTPKNNPVNAQQDDKAALASAPQEASPRAYPSDKVTQTPNTSLVRQENAYQPIDKRTLNALNAYRQEYNQTAQDRNVDAPASLDTYV